MDSSSVTDAHILGLNIDGDVHDNQNLPFEDNSSLRRKRLHLDSESSSADNEVSSLTGFIMGKRIKLENHSDDDGGSRLMRENSCDELGDDGGIILESAASGGMASAPGGMPFPSVEENGDEDGCVLIHHMDIKEPLTNLKKALEETHGICLEGYEFYLQDTTLIDFFGVAIFKSPEKLRIISDSDSEEFPHIANFEEIQTTGFCHVDGIDFFGVAIFKSPEKLRIISDSDSEEFPHIANFEEIQTTGFCHVDGLAGHKNLVEQCVQGCGTVQVNLQLKIEDDGTKKINIIDVLKPSDSYLLATGNPAFSPDTPEAEASPPATKEDDPKSEQNLIRWNVDHSFKANQQRLNIPQDPLEWDVSHVRHWLLWAVRQFNLTGIKLTDWKITGSQLCNLTLEDFKARVPYDPSDIFWTHLELLRRCKFVAVMQNPEDATTQEETDKKEKDTGNCLDKNIMRNREKKFKTQPIAVDPAIQPIPNNNWGHRSGNNGQVQLWQFLLDLLTDKDHRECIQWLGAEGEFKLIEPERVAQLWGMRKNKPNMNYEKLSRALRYYYDGDMIAKVHGKRFVYKFVCDLKHLMGYSAYELNRLVIEAEMKALNASNDPIQHSIFGHREF